VAVALETRLNEILRASPRVMQVLRRLRDLDLPDWRLSSGAVYQTVWNALTERDPNHGIKDFDTLYFDPDTSWDAEDAVIRRVASALEPPLREMVEVRNQGRVHLWFEQKFAEPYTPLGCTDESLERYVAPAFAVGVRLERDDRLSVAAPFGLGDTFAMVLRPNPNRVINPAGLDKVVRSLTARWPEIRVSA
jgi:uncharacterized protein